MLVVSEMTHGSSHLVYTPMASCVAVIYDSRVVVSDRLMARGVLYIQGGEDS